MTTIAFDGKTVAADGQRTWGDEIRELGSPKIKLLDGRIYSFTGSTPLFQPVVDWHRSGADPKSLPVMGREESWTLIVIDHDGLGKYTPTCPYIERFKPPIAFGAGGDYAMGAMLAGADAKRAVELVAGLCNHTGGVIQAVNVADALRASLAEAAE